jgi:hypothetical protein
MNWNWQSARGKCEADPAKEPNLSKPVNFHQVDSIPDGIRLAQRFVPPPHWSISPCRNRQRGFVHVNPLRRAPSLFPPCTFPVCWFRRSSFCVPRPSGCGGPGVVIDSRMTSNSFIIRHPPPRGNCRASRKVEVTAPGKRVDD